jgi:hypothetical protein
MRVGSELARSLDIAENPGNDPAYPFGIRPIVAVLREGEKLATVTKSVGPIPRDERVFEGDVRSRVVTPQARYEKSGRGGGTR